MVDFIGTMKDESGSDLRVTQVLGQYRWIDEGSPLARIAGLIVVPRAFGDLFDHFGGVKTFRGRIARLSIPGVGLSPIRMYSDGQVREDRTTWVTFEAWLPPVPIASKSELADALWTPIADALEDSGLGELAGLARAAAIALVGFPKPPRKGKG